jgi:formate hydrogenlyase subunit 6/NADH:ubiquinone oxidoreductase subunit I/flavodoxin
MNGIICYHSNTGNTHLVAQKTAAFLAPFSVDLCDMKSHSPVNPLKYDFFGFASPVEFFGLPHKAKDWIGHIPKITAEKYAFILLTYGGIPGTAIIQMKDLVQSRNFRVIAGHALPCPESYPPLRARGFKNASSPNRKALLRFNMFAKILKELCFSALEEKEILEAKLRLGVVNYFFNIPDSNASKRNMGFKYLEKDRCIHCGLCVESCPHNAIIMKNTWPGFLEELCKGCWKCYNRCPTKAIYTSHIKGAGQYQGASEIFKQKMLKLEIK